jgi:hypothetical protein
MERHLKAHLYDISTAINDLPKLKEEVDALLTSDRS